MAWPLSSPGSKARDPGQGSFLAKGQLMNHSKLEGNRGAGRSLSLKRPSNNCGLYISVYTILTLSKIHFPFWELQQKVKGEGMEELRGTPRTARGNARARSRWQHRRISLCSKGDACANIVPLKKCSWWIGKSGRKEKGVSKESLDKLHWAAGTGSCWAGQLCPAAGAVRVSQHSLDSFFSFRSAPCGVRFCACNILPLLLPDDLLQTCRVHLHKKCVGSGLCHTVYRGGTVSF